MFLEPPLLFGLGKGLVHEEELAHLRVIEPAHKARDVLPLDRPKPQILPVEHRLPPKKKRGRLAAAPLTFW
jgi:hypothetical protein